jgi:hypothetical protein
VPRSFRQCLPSRGDIRRGSQAGPSGGKALQFPHHERSVTRAPGRRARRGTVRLVRRSFTRVSPPMCSRATRKGGSWSSGSGAGNGDVGLPTMDACGSLSPLRETGDVRERETGLRAWARARIGRSKGCARALAELRRRRLGTARKRAGIVAEVVRRRSGPEEATVTTTHKSWCHGVNGDLARGERAAWRHARKDLAESGRLFGVRSLARGRALSRGGRAKRQSFRVEPRRQSRGIDQGPGGPSRLGNEARKGRRWVPERWKAPRVVKVVCVSRAGGVSGLGNLRRVVKKACKRHDSNRGK